MHKRFEGMPIIPLGLDLETSSTEQHNGVILSIGLYDPSGTNWGGRHFYTEIRYTQPIPICAEAMRVNKLKTTLLDNPNLPTLEEAEEKVLWWIRKNHSKPYSYIPVGFNVGSFDMAFIKVHMPRLHALFGYRSVDLNSLLIAEAVNRKSHLIELKKWYKKKAESSALRICQDGPHNALFDAAQAIFILQQYTQNLTDLKKGVMHNE